MPQRHSKWALPPGVEPRCSGRIRNPALSKPENIYGQRPPAEIERDINQTQTWQEAAENSPRTSPEPVPRLSSVNNPDLPGTSASNPHADNDQQTDQVAKLARERGVTFINYLLAKAVPLEDNSVDTRVPDPSHVREWSFKDIMKFAPKEHKEWLDACHEELEALCKCNVYKAVDHPKGCKVIKCHWVFDIKTDGQKKSRLLTD